MNAGLCGYAVDTGIGQMTKAMLRCLPFDKFLHVYEPSVGWGDDPGTVASWRYSVKRDWPSAPVVDGFLDGLDVVVCVERCWPAAFFAHAKARGIRTVLIVMPEWFHPTREWGKSADVLISHARAGYDHLVKLGCRSRAVYTPIPLDIESLPFTQRQRANRFLFVNGYGGINARSGSGEIFDALAMRPGLVDVCSQKQIALPRGTRMIAPCATPADVYANADVMVRPSRHEGLGLTVLEAMASGCAVLTTNGLPMREFIQECYGPRASEFLLAVANSDMISPAGVPWHHYIVEPASIVDKVDQWRGKDIASESVMGREYIESVHGESAWNDLWRIIGYGN